VGKRSRRRDRRKVPSEGPGGGLAALAAAPTGEYTDAQGNLLTLRGVLTPATRGEYAQVLSGSPLSREDAWQRAVEFLFERLAVRWEIAGAPLESQRELLARFRTAGPEERMWVREVLREHCAEHFPDVRAP
jgi:hypothetical protein